MGTSFVVAVVVLAFALYFLPFFVAVDRKHRNVTAIGALTLLLGWTFIGWVVALVWALSKPAHPTIYVMPKDEPIDCVDFRDEPPL